MDNRKLTLEEFNSYTDRMKKILEEYEKVVEERENDPNFDEEKFEMEVIEKYLELQNQLLQYDLSDIPFESWKDVNIICLEGQKIDFSKTHANLDFYILDMDFSHINTKIEGYINFKGCNCKNIDYLYHYNENFFDENTIIKNKEIFLSDIFPKELRDKYYDKKIEASDLKSMSKEQLDEMKGKNLKQHTTNATSGLIEIFGIEKTIKLILLDDFNNDHLELIISTYFYKKRNDNFDENKFFDDLLSMGNVQNIKDYCYNEMKKKISEIGPGPAYFPKIFVKDNSDIFLQDVSMDSSLKNKYYYSALTYEDIRDNIDLFSDNVIYGVSEYTDIYKLLNKIGYSNLKYLIENHRDILDYLSSIEELDSFSEYLEEDFLNIEDEFINSVKYYYLNSIDDELEYKEVDGKKVYIFPKWLESINFSVIDKYENFKEMLNYNNSIIVLDENQSGFLDGLGISNIKEFDKETGYFSNCDDITFPYLLETMEMFFKHKQLYREARRINFKDGNLTYEEFKREMAKLLDGMRNNSHLMFSYGFIEGKFRDEYPEIFIDKSAPPELKEAFYSGEITPELIKKHPEYIPYLEGKNCFNIPIISLSNDGRRTNLYGLVYKICDLKTGLDFVLDYKDIIETFIKDDMNLEDYTSFESLFSFVNTEFRRMIIEKGLVYPEHIPDKLIKEHPEMFLKENASPELKRALYHRTINTDFILSNPKYIEELKNVDVEIIYNYMPVKVDGEKKVNIIKIIKDKFKDNSLVYLILYGDYLEKIYEKNGLKSLSLNSDISIKDLVDKIDSVILDNILSGKIKYNEDMFSGFKLKNPNLFLDSSVFDDITRRKFYNREFSLEDFNKNPDLINKFGNTCIACGFPLEYSWLISLYGDDTNNLDANLKRLKIISESEKIFDSNIRGVFKEYIIENKDNLDFNKIDILVNVLKRLSQSNSVEMVNFRTELARQLIKSNSPIESLNRIENIFIKNNLPAFGKVYSCFETLHPDFQGFDFEDIEFSKSMISPVLKSTSTRGKKVVAFSDLVKASFGSNNRSVNNYLDNIEIASRLFEEIRKENISYDDLNEKEKNELVTFCNHLITLYNNTQKGRREEEIIKESDNVIDIISDIYTRLDPNGSLDYNLADRVINMYCGFAGITSLDEAKRYIKQKVSQADKRNREVANQNMVLEKGDFVKGIGDITYLGVVLQNGSVSKEYLGASADSDATPLDTDVSMILTSEGSIDDKLNDTACSGYGPIWFVLKNDDRFITTRTKEEELDAKRDMSKLEVFYTGVLGDDHYGIRTGFASSDINYIMVDSYDYRIGLEIAMNGFYIPVVNKEGHVIFTPDDYDKLREKMNGLSYYGISEYIMDESKNVRTQEIDNIINNMNKNVSETEKKASLIWANISKSSSELGLSLTDKIDLDKGSLVLFNTGSTGRNTNLPGDGDFDYTMQVDREIYESPERMDLLKSTLIKGLSNGKEISYVIVGNDIRELKTTFIDEEGVEHEVEVDITFSLKTDKVEYASDVCVLDRLNSIKNPDDRDIAKANIILAKQLLKGVQAYKPARKDADQGGMGGIGVENWILQNGGTLYSAAKSFMEVAEECDSFEEFVSKYHLPDFGINHIGIEKRSYPHDDYISNMNSTGYEKIKATLSVYIKKYESGIENPVLETINSITGEKNIEYNESIEEFKQY